MTVLQASLQMTGALLAGYVSGRLLADLTHRRYIDGLIKDKNRLGAENTQLCADIRRFQRAERLASNHPAARAARLRLATEEQRRLRAVDE